MKKINFKKGFTLIELMIVVAIIGILAAIAIPNFLKYQLRSKTSEAKTVIGGIKTSQESFRAEYDTYAEWAVRPAGGPARNFKTTWGSNSCPANCTRIEISMGNGANCNEAECVGYAPAGDVYYEYEATAQHSPAVPEYKIGTQADLDADTLIGGFYFPTCNDTAVCVGVAGPNGAADPAAVAGVDNSVCGATSVAFEVNNCNAHVY